MPPKLSVKVTLPAVPQFKSQPPSPSFSEWTLYENRVFMEAIRWLVAQTVKNPPAMLETWVPSLGREDPLEKVISAVVLCLH